MGSNDGRLVLYDPENAGLVPPIQFGDFYRRLKINSEKKYCEFIFSPKALIPVGWVAEIWFDPGEIALLTGSVDQSKLFYSITHNTEKSDASITQGGVLGANIPFSIRGERIWIPANGFTFRLEALVSIDGAPLSPRFQILSKVKGAWQAHPVVLNVPKNTDAEPKTDIPNFAKRFRFTPPAGSATPPDAAILFYSQNGDLVGSFDAINGTLQGYISPLATQVSLSGGDIADGGADVEFEIF
jgi:hypothetical protein